MVLGALGAVGVAVDDDDDVDDEDDEEDGVMDDVVDVGVVFENGVVD